MSGDGDELLRPETLWACLSVRVGKKSEGPGCGAGM